MYGDDDTWAWLSAFLFIIAVISILCLVSNTGDNRTETTKLKTNISQLQNENNHLRFYNCVLTHELHKDRLIVCPAP